MNRHDALSHVVFAGDALGLLLRSRQGGQQHRRENRNDGDDDQKLDQRESTLALAATARRCATTKIRGPVARASGLRMCRQPSGLARDVTSV